ncbi:hypothetical protein Lser_V15G04793 [Lactuca serriola]
MNNSAAPVPVTMEPVDPVHWYGCGHGRPKAGHTIDVKRNTVKIKCDPIDKEKHFLTFTYDAQVAGCITVLIYQSVGQEKKEVFKISKDVEKGTGQIFVHEGDGVKFPLLKKGLKEAYKLEILAQVTEDGSKNCILEKTEAVIQSKCGITKVKVKNQILLANGWSSVFVELNGRSYSTRTDADDPYHGCCICFNKENPGIVFPIGGLQLIEKPIVEESNGNRVYKGTYDKSSVTVERIPKVHGHVTNQVIQILKESVQHPNIVGFVAKVETENFVFYVYERCECSLHDLISSVFHDKKSNEYKVGIPSFMHLKLWKPDNNSPSECLLKLLRGIVEGIVHFDKHGIIPNLNPRRIFICKAPSGITAKVLGMGISATGKSSFIISCNI